MATQSAGAILDVLGGVRGSAELGEGTTTRSREQDAGATRQPNSTDEAPDRPAVTARAKTPDAVEDAARSGDRKTPAGLLAALLDNASPMLAVDRLGICRLANPAAVALAVQPDLPLEGVDVTARLPLLGDRRVARVVERARQGRSGAAEILLPDSGRTFAVRAIPAGELVLLYLDETTERRAAEAAAAQAVEQARLASLAGVTGTYESDLIAQTAWLSEQARRIVGFEPAAEAVYSRDALVEAVLPDDRAVYAAAIAGAAANPGGVYDVTFRIVRPSDGVERTLHAVGEVLRDQNGRPRTMVGSISDITDRAVAEAALRISEDRLRRVVEGVDAIISYRDDGQSEVVHSPQIAEMLGYRPGELTDNEAWDALVHPDDLAQCMAVWQGPDPAWTLTYRMRRADGTYVWVEDRGRWIERGDERGRGLIGVITDITERKRVEEALRASQDRLQQIVGGVDGIISYVESAGAPIVQSAQIERILGYKPEAVSTESDWYALIHPDDLERCRALWRQRPSNWAITYRMRRADGSWIWVDDRGQQHENPDGRAPGYVSVVVDVTERVEAGQARRLADERRRLFFDANIIGTVVDVDGAVVEANDYWLQLVGRTRAELEHGKLDWKGVTAPESLAADEEGIAQCRAFGSCRPYEKVYRQPDGTTVPALIARASLPGEAEQHVAFVLDLTEQKAAAAEMAQLAAAIEQTSESVIVTDSRARIGYVNPAFERTTGYARAEVIGHNPSLLQSGAHDHAFYREMWGTLLRGETWRGELINRRKDGGIFTEVVAISPVRDPHGRVTAYVAVKRDVTAERELEARLSQAQRLEAIGQLAGGIAHDFNNLLAVIRGYADLARAAMPAGPANEDLDQVVLAADRASSLTRQLLLFSRRQAAALAVLDVGVVVDGLAPMLRRLLGEHIELEVAPAMPSAGLVRADPSQLEQVVLNLAANARDAMPDGGRLTIRTEANDESDAAWVRLTAADTGVGMDETTSRHVFEPFFTTKAPGRGTGLGLATVYGIVTQSGGRVSVASTPGQGTTFIIDLPRVDAPAEPTTDQVEARPARVHRPLTVLLVEDDSAVRSLTRRMLASLGHTVICAGSGAEALELVEAASGMPDLLLTDVRMPGIQGPDLARRLRDRRPDLPVVFTSGFSAELDESMAIPGARVLDKPFDAAKLDAAVRNALGPEG
jgi:two-component system cell cycle sensor histidine kinase/response regulator CckA